ncbi:MAG TPA: hypothetical protein VNB22_08935 [Pyrinomonadaceae bacterium]|nr:hypothetical protein [Pyrinomonadaceae bacterium]
MSSFAWIITLTLVLTALGTLVLLLITLKYYWGARGTPPVTGEERRLQKEAELILRAKQIEQSKKNRWETRSSDFFDNRKSSTKK